MKLKSVGLLIVNLKGYDQAASLEELSGLAMAADLSVDFIYKVKINKINSRYFIGSGHVAILAKKISDSCCSQLLINQDLSASIQKHLSASLKIDVVDRTELILHIFALHARTFAGKLQVELAQLTRLSTRLIRGWTHLERQKGGIGLRGPGETQLETDRRLIKQRIKYIKNRLEKVKTQRQQTSKARRKSRMPNIVLVGYTNAGKSTLFNALTKANVLMADYPFATLDPTVRKLHIPNKQPMLLIDTVGFICGLPPEIVEAFHATLDAVLEADLLLHVVDSQVVNTVGHKLACKDVDDVLYKLGADNIPVLYVYNKQDLLDNVCALDYGENICRVSALTGYGLEDLISMLDVAINGNNIKRKYFVNFSQTEVRAKLLDSGRVVAETEATNGWWLTILQLKS